MQIYKRNIFFKFDEIANQSIIGENCNQIWI